MLVLILWVWLSARLNSYEQVYNNGFHELFLFSFDLF